MPLTPGTTYIPIKADLTPLKNDMRSVEQITTQGAAKAAAGMEKSWSSSLTKAAGSLQTFGQKTRLVSLGAAGALGLATKAASDLNETMSFTEVTFKSASDDVIAWSKTTLDSMGIAQESALDAANQFGGLLQVTGSTAAESATLSKELVQLAVDMSSAKNVRLEDAITALGSGLRGEAEPMRKFNVLLSEQAIKAYAVKNGIAEQNAELTEGQKVQARLGLIMEQTTDIQGDYARTADSAANSQRRAQEAAKEAGAELGQALTPIMAKAADVAADLVKWFTNLPEPIQNTVVGLGLVTAAASPMATLAAAVIKAGVAIQGSTAAATLFGTAMNAIPWLLIAAGAAAVANEVGENGLAGAMDKANDALGDMGDLLPRALGWVQDSGAIIADAIGEVAEAVEKANQAMSPEAITAWSERLDALARSYGYLKGPSHDFVTDTENASKAVNNFAKLTKEEMQEWKGSVVDSVGASAKAVKDFADDTDISTQDVKDALQSLIDAQVNFRGNWKRVFDVVGKDTDDLVNFLSERLGVDAPKATALLADMSNKDIKRILGLYDDWKGEAGRTERVVSGNLRDAGKSGQQAGSDIKEGMDRGKGGMREARREAKKVLDVLKDILEFSDVEIAMQFRSVNMPTYDQGGGGLGGGPLGNTLVAIGRNLQAQGFRVTGHSAFPPVGAHTEGSYHYIDRAIDINWGPPGESAEEMSVLTGLGRKLDAHHNPVELLGPWNDPDHRDHLHLAMDMGGIVRGPARIYQGSIDEAHIPLSGAGAQAGIDLLANAMEKAGGSAGPTFVIHGDVYGFDDFKKKVSQATTENVFNLIGT
jgi:hypothetical protein